MPDTSNQADLTAAVDQEGDEWHVDLKAFSFKDKATAEAFRDALLEAFCAMPEASEVAGVLAVIEGAPEVSGLPDQEAKELRRLASEAADVFVEIGELCWDKIDRDALKAACDEASNLAGEAEERFRKIAVSGSLKTTG